MLEKRMIRRHPITLAPDLLLILAGSFFMTIGYMRMDWVFIRELCYFFGGFFWICAAIDILCWFGFRLEIGFPSLMAQRCWIWRRHYDLAEIQVEFSQNWWDALWDKGTLTIYTPEGDILTLRSLAHFSTWAQYWSQWLPSKQVERYSERTRRGYWGR